MGYAGKFIKKRFGEHLEYADDEDLEKIKKILGEPGEEFLELLENKHFDELKAKFCPDLRKPTPEDFGLDSNNMSEAQEADAENQKAKAHNIKMYSNFFSIKNIWSMVLPIIGPLTEDIVFKDKKINPLGESYTNYIKMLSKYPEEQEILKIKERMRFLEARKKEAEYWFLLGGHKFEEEVSKLFQESGSYSSVVKTKGSGDGGIDLILTVTDGTMTLVQCKAHKKEVGPHVARDLYGAMHSAGISKGIIISLGGVTKGVRDFIKDKDILIIDVNDIIKMQKSSSGQKLIEK
jgi:hypothetical protein